MFRELCSHLYITVCFVVFLSCNLKEIQLKKTLIKYLMLDTKLFFFFLSFSFACQLQTILKSYSFHFSDLHVVTKVAHRLSLHKTFYPLSLLNATRATGEQNETRAVISHLIINLIIIYQILLCLDDKA